MKFAYSSFLHGKVLRDGALIAAVGFLAATPAQAVDNPLTWYGSGAEGGEGGDGEWSAVAGTASWFDGTSYYTWAEAVPLYGPSNTNLIVANFGGTAGTVTVGNLGPNNSTFIGTLNVTTGGYVFAGEGSIALAAPDRVHLVVDTADNTPVLFEAGVSFNLRSSGRTFEIADGDELTIAGVIDNGRVIKTGNGTLRLTGENTLNANGITVSAGTVFLSNTTGSALGNGGITVASGATLGGTGIIAPTAARSVTIAGTLSPGENSVGTLTLAFSNTQSRLVFEEGSSLDFTLGTESDLVAFSEAGDWLSGSGLVTLNLTQGEGFSYEESYTIFENLTTEEFTFLEVTGFDDSTYQAVFSLEGDNYVLTFAAVPEPTVAALLVISALFGGWRYTRKRRAV